MAPTVPNGEPTELIAADTWQWNKHLSAYPPSEGWGLAYTLQGPAVLAAAIDAATSADGDYFEVRHAPDSHSDLVQGGYTLLGRVSHADGREFTVYEGALFIRVHNTSTASTSNDEQLLAKLEAARLTLAVNGHASITVNGRSVEYTETDQLDRAIGAVRARVGIARRGGRFQTRKAHVRRA